MQCTLLLALETRTFCFLQNKCLRFIGMPC
jgi:hypothetical protein